MYAGRDSSQMKFNQYLLHIFIFIKKNGSWMKNKNEQKLTANQLNLLAKRIIIHISLLIELNFFSQKKRECNLQNYFARFSLRPLVIENEM